MRRRRTPRRTWLPAGRSALGAAARDDGEARSMRLRTPGRRRPSVLFAGQSYYHAWYLSRELRKLGWRADVLNWNCPQTTRASTTARTTSSRGTRPGRAATCATSGSTSARCRATTSSTSPTRTVSGSASRSMMRWRSASTRTRRSSCCRRLGKKIVYSNNGCLDGVSQTSFASWGDTPVCLDCPWRERPDICSDERNLAWGHNRNRLADFQMHHRGQPQGLQRRSDGPRGSGVLLPRPGVLAPRPGGPGAASGSTSGRAP